MKRTILILITLVSIYQCADAQIFIADGFRFRITDPVKKTVALGNSNTTSTSDFLISVMDCIPWICDATTDYSGDINIPEKVVYNSTEYLVTEICIAAFAGCTDLKSVVMPNSITKIHPGAFFGCSSLENITLSTNAEGVYSTTFEGCAALERLDLSSLRFAELNLAGCTSLREIDLPINGLYYNFSNFNENCKFYYKSATPPYALYANFNGLPEKSTLYVENVDLFWERRGTFYQFEYIEPISVASIDGSETPNLHIIINGSKVTAPHQTNITIFDIKGNPISKIKAGETVLLAPGAYIGSAKGETLKFVVE